MSESKRLFWPDLLRAISCLAVVLIHITSIAVNDYAINTDEYLISAIVNGLCRWAVPIFFMVSGMFLLDPNHKMTKEKLKSKIFKLILIILVWGLFYSILDDFAYGNLSVASIPKAILYILKGTAGYHLWFLYTILLIYLMLPLLRLITEKASLKLLTYGIILWFVFSITVGYINALGNTFSLLKTFSVSYSLEFLSQNAGYFVLGYILLKTDISLKKVSSLIAVLSVIFIVASNIICLKFFNLNAEVIATPNGSLTCILSVAIFVIFKEFKFKENPTFLQKWGGTGISNLSLGIYLVHVFYITLIFRVFKVDMFLFGDFSILIWFIVVSFLSCLTAYVLKKIPYVKEIVNL